MEHKDIKKGSELTPPASDASYAEKASFNLKRQADVMQQSLTSAVDRQQAIQNNPNATSTNKQAATVLAGAEMALSLAGNLKSIGMRVSESLMMPLFEKLSFLKGMACLPVLKQTDPVMGIDIHNVIIPPSPVVPMPHPYIGILFRPKDFVSCSALSILPVPPEPEPVNEESDSAAIAKSNAAKAASLVHTAAVMAINMIGASVKLGDYLPRAVAGTPTQNVPHIPMGAGFSPPFALVEKNVGHSYLGSLIVLADNEPLSGAVAHLHNDCWDVGATNLHTEDGVMKAVRFYVPSGIQTSIPMGKPVLTNPVPIPVNAMSIGKKLLKAGLGKLKKVAGKVAKKAEMMSRKAVEKALNKIGQNPKLKAKMGGCAGLTKLSKKFGLGLSHPVDAAEGYFYTDNVDFSLPGVIPVDFERTYYSYSNYQGPLGTGWHHAYDMALAFDHDDNIAAFRQSDGRTTGFQIPARGGSFFNRKEKLWLHRTENDSYYISDLEGLLYYFTDREYHNPHNKTEAHLLQSIANRNGYAIRFEYSPDGILKKMTDTAGRDILFETDHKGHITAISTPGQTENSPRITVARYTYDAIGRLTVQTDALGHEMYFEYNGHLMTKEIWRNGLTWQMNYKGTGVDAKCIEITGNNDLMHYKINYVAPDCTIAVNSLGDQTTYYHRNGFVTKRIDPNGGEHVFRYNNDNELEWTTDAVGNGEGETHDEYGNLVTKTAADGGFTSLKYENRDFPYLPTSAIDAAGGRWQWTYDEHGNLAQRTDPVGAVTAFGYSDGLLSGITGAEKQQTHLEYDRHGNLIKTVSPDGGINRWQYDLLGQCLQHENPKGGVTEYAYDLLGQVTKVREPDGNIRELTYDREGNVIHARDNDRDVSFTYRGVNKLASRTERGATLRFLYDTEDQLRCVVNEADERYTFALDTQGNVIEETGFDGLSRIYHRDLAGRVTTVMRPDGRLIKYEYDPAGRVTKVIYNPDDKKGQTEETYEYRRDGALIKAVNENAEVILERDILGRVVKEISNGVEVVGKYDLSGNRTHITSTLGADIKAEYNIMGDVVSLAGGGWQTQYRRDLFGLETERTFAGGVHSHTERDRLGRVTGQKFSKNSRSLTEKSYLWGANDKLLSVITDGKAKHFSYDGWGNLSKTVFEDGHTEHRNPDKVGNLFERLDRLDRKYTQGGRLHKTENRVYRYDKEGNLILKKDIHGATWCYRWNEAGMLASVRRPDAKEVFFTYDALGRRIEKKFGGVTTRWVWDGNVPLHECRSYYRRDWDKIQKSIYWEEQKHPLVTWIFEEGTFVPTAKLTESSKLSIATNYLGTPEAMYREDGQAVWTCELNSYGKVRNYQGATKTDCPFRYQGQYEDAETGLYYNRFRYYSPEEGLYLSQDPIGLWGGFKFYSYVFDTNKEIDELGLSPGQPFTDSKGLTLIVKNQQDLSHMTTAQLEYMKEYGVAGTTKGGRSSGREKIILHHQKQNPNGPIIELPASKHNLGNRKLHPFGNKKGAGVGKNRPDFDNWRKEYWQNRANDELKLKKSKGNC